MKIGYQKSECPKFHLNNNPGLVTDHNNLKRGKGGENRRKEIRKEDRGRMERES